MSEYVLPSLGVLLLVVLTLALSSRLWASMSDESKLALEPGERILGKGQASLARDNNAPLNLDSFRGYLFWTDRRLMWRPLAPSFGTPIDIWLDGAVLEGQDGILFNYRLWAQTDEATFRFAMATRRNRDAILEEQSRSGRRINN